MIKLRIMQKCVEIARELFQTISLQVTTDNNILTVIILIITIIKRFPVCYRDWKSFVVHQNGARQTGDRCGR